LLKVQTELGSDDEILYADLERKLNALEARIKALEKMVFLDHLPLLESSAAYSENENYCSLSEPR